MAELMEVIVTTRKCKRCRWSTNYYNWTPPGERKKPDTWVCKNPNYPMYSPDCPEYVEPDEEGDIKY